MLLRMLAATVVLVIGLAIAPPADACGGGYFWGPNRPSKAPPAPVPVAACLAQDLRTGFVREIRVSERAVSWSMLGDPRWRYEQIRLADREMDMLRAYADNGTIKLTRPRVRNHKREPLWLTLAPTLVLLFGLLVVLVRLKRRHAFTVRVLTRNVQRREAFALVYATVVVVALVVGTWPHQRTVTMDQLRTGVKLGMIHEVTFGRSQVSFRHVASNALFVVPEAADLELKQLVRGTIMHTPDPERPHQTLHHIRVHDQSGTAGLVSQAIPWAGALTFWFVWVYLIRRQSWW